MLKLQKAKSIRALSQFFGTYCYTEKCVCCYCYVAWHEPHLLPLLLDEEHQLQAEEGVGVLPCALAC